MALVPVGVVGTASTDDVREGETFTSETAGKGVEGSMSDNGSGHISGPSDTLSGEGYYSGISNGIDDNGTLYINDATDSGGSGYYSSIQNNINSRSGNVDPIDLGDSLGSGYYSSSISTPDPEDVVEMWGPFYEPPDKTEFEYWGYKELATLAMLHEEWDKYVQSNYDDFLETGAPGQNSWSSLPYTYEDTEITMESGSRFKNESHYIQAEHSGPDHGRHSTDAVIWEINIDTSDASTVLIDAEATGRWGSNITIFKDGSRVGYWGEERKEGFEIDVDSDWSVDIGFGLGENNNSTGRAYVSNFRLE